MGYFLWLETKYKWKWCKWNCLQEAELINENGANEIVYKWNDQKRTNENIFIEQECNDQRPDSIQKQNIKFETRGPSEEINQA